MEIEILCLKGSKEIIAAWNATAFLLVANRWISYTWLTVGDNCSLLKSISYVLDFRIITIIIIIWWFSIISKIHL